MIIEKKVDAFMDIDRLIKELTIEEKISLLMGKNVWWTKDIKRLGIPSIMMADGPHGIRKQKNESDNLGLNQAHLATCFPTTATVACSFDRDLVYQMGQAIAREARSRGVSIVLGPGINIKRSPLCGRNFEYFSEDPYLTGELAYSFIRGVEDQKIGTSLKHFAFNNQETLRMTSASVIDERAKHEIYLSGFKRAVQAKPATIMTSYNKIETGYVGEDKSLLQGLVRDAWGYQGVMISDWGAISNRTKALKAGLDIEMPYSGEYHKTELLKAYQDGVLTDEEINRSVKRILNMVDTYPVEKVKTHLFHHEFACEIAKNSAVLLQNTDQLCPLKRDKEYLVVGEFATKPRFQGGGSSHISTNQVESFLDILEEEQVTFEYAAGYNLKKTDEINLDLIEDAAIKAKGKDAVILFLGLPDAYESEGFDRTHLFIPKSHSILIGHLQEVNPNIVVVLQCGSPIIMPWRQHVKAILHMYLSGEASNRACYELLFGHVSPSGKLAETYPLDLEDVPSYSYFPGGNTSVHYKESIYVGYRYYDTFDVDVTYPFGYGLSYTTFSYSHLTITKKVMNVDEDVNVSVRVKNTGSMKAKETVFLFVKNAPSLVFKAKKELREFAKVELEPGESKTIHFTLSKEAFTFYNTMIQEFHVETGLYQIEIGKNVKDIPLSTDIMVTNDEKIPLPQYQTKAKSYYTFDQDEISDQEFEGLLGYTPPPLNLKKVCPFTLDSTLDDVKSTPFGRLLHKIIKKEIKKMSTNADDWMNALMEKVASEQPLRSLVSMGGGVITKEMMISFIEMINGHYGKGIKQLLKASKSKQKDYQKER